ncbi:MAG: hypothetical protein ACI9VM_000297 [Candidatus Azotimanducaceae bacterium]|jgi:hypothetical protein
MYCIRRTHPSKLSMRDLLQEAAPDVFRTFSICCPSVLPSTSWGYHCQSRITGFTHNSVGTEDDSDSWDAQRRLAETLVCELKRCGSQTSLESYGSASVLSINGAAARSFSEQFDVLTGMPAYTAGWLLNLSQYHCGRLTDIDYRNRLVQQSQKLQAFIARDSNCKKDDGTYAMIMTAVRREFNNVQ